MRASATSLFLNLWPWNVSANHCLKPSGGKAISLNIFNLTAKRRSALGPADQSRAPLTCPVPNAELTVRDKCFSRDGPSLSNCLLHLCKNVHNVHA